MERWTNARTVSSWASVLSGFFHSIPFCFGLFSRCKLCKGFGQLSFLPCAGDVGKRKHCLFPFGKRLTTVNPQHLSLGYHFTLINANLRKMSIIIMLGSGFWGGIIQDPRRTRRADFPGQVVANNDFRIELYGDQEIACIKNRRRKICGSGFIFLVCWSVSLGSLMAG
jgi:hypothetical protein